MLTVKKSLDGDVPKFELSGVIDDQTNFDLVVGASVPLAHLYCKGVTRINSVGVKSWRDYFHKWRSAGGKLVFYELSPALVSQIGFLADFIELPEIESLCVPFYCNACSTLTLKPYPLGPLIETQSNLELIPCPKCGGPTEFDEVPEEYFSFLQG